MRPKAVIPKVYLFLQENGIDIDACVIDYKLISVRCQDLSLYRKAFRVKIRTMIKNNDTHALKPYIDAFYTFTQFAQYLYGFHSCGSEVEEWQEQLAYYLQTRFDESSALECTKDSLIKYASVNEYEKSFKELYQKFAPDVDSESLPFVQDAKPFLNQKDQSHFDKFFNYDPYAGFDLENISS